MCIRLVVSVRISTLDSRTMRVYQASHSVQTVSCKCFLVCCLMSGLRECGKLAKEWRQCSMASIKCKCPICRTHPHYWQCTEAEVTDLQVATELAWEECNLLTERVAAIKSLCPYAKREDVIHMLILTRKPHHG